MSWKKNSELADVLIDSLKAIRCIRCRQVLLEQTGERLRPHQVIAALFQHKQECKGRQNGEGGPRVP